ncbi:hypothetical protein BTJ39_23235 [Izhakiella australiensis]|uniref:GNAT family N-acetyltransferase n=1 Tax=Izhakiella australiensis TaxID=1926881 RepID=A0A1S8Y7A8_9GAMM|nr:hypothetical protein [Izhakiella australiensis]OON34728.1 hypothetical protein BTJ39_23235 [Izhakiella australiensis]
MKCRHASKGDLDRVCEVLATAFYSEPLHQIIFPDSEKRLETLRNFFRIYVDLASERGGTLLTENNAGVLVYFRPDSMYMNDKERILFDNQLRDVCGSCYNAALTLNNGLEYFHPEAPSHFYISLLAVHKSSRGGSLVSSLFNTLNTMLDREGFPCYAECTRLSTRTLLRRWGYYDAASPLRIEGMPELYPVWREPR